MKQKGCKERGVVVVGKKIMVAVGASKEIPKAALLLTLTHVVQPGDRIRLHVVFPSNYTSKTIWGFSRFTSDCASGYGRFLAGTNSDRKSDLHDYDATEAYGEVTGDQVHLAFYQQPVH